MRRRHMLRGNRNARRGLCVPLILALAGAWLLVFALSRAHMVLQAYTDLAEVREDESWLREQCSTTEFYSRLKQHSALCDDVAHRHRDIMLLQAIKYTIDHSFLCGYDPCAELLDRLALWAVGRGLMFTLSLVAVCVFGPVCLLPVYRRHLNSVADERIREQYYAPVLQDSTHHALRARRHYELLE